MYLGIVGIFMDYTSFELPKERYYWLQQMPVSFILIDGSLVKSTIFLVNVYVNLDYWIFYYFEVLICYKV